MNKAKIIFSAIGILSIVSGTLAFKIHHRFTGTLSCYTSSGKFVSGVRYTTTVSGSVLKCTLCNNPGEYVPQTVVMNQ